MQCIALCLLAMAFAGQTFAQAKSAGSVQNGIAASRVKGIKILSSSFDPSTLAGKITFVNDSVARISAFQGRLVVTHAQGEAEDRELGADLLVAYDTYYLVEVRKRPGFHELWRHSIYPGETYTEEFTVGFYPQNPVVSVQVVYNAAIYSDNTAEAADENAVRTIADRRLGHAQREKQIVKVSSDVQAAHAAAPLALLAANLKGEGLAGPAELLDLKPSLPSDRNDQNKLAQFIADHRLKAKILEDGSKLKVVAQ